MVAATLAADLPADLSLRDVAPRVTGVAGGRGLTLTEFAACDLNAKTAAERLHLHVNTAYYRLERIAERTGCDLRRLSDVLELMIAVRLLTRESS